MEHYRPISKLCLCIKELEKIVFRQVYAVLKPVLSQVQHGFMQGRSTVTNLALFTDRVARGVEGGGQVDAVYTDYSKAFDRVDHNILLKKLQASGIRGDLLRWFTSYLELRSQRVALNGYVSPPTFIPSGVPQGSVLAPLLFAIFINDIDKCFMQSDVLLFADDMKVSKSIITIDDATNLQNDLLRLENYCLKNKLDLNIQKCNIISFTRKPKPILFPYKINNQLLERTDKVRDLGILLDSKLLFDQHVDAITKKANQLLGFLLRLSKNFDRAKTLKVLYCALVRSHLEYGSQIWNPSYQVQEKQIEKVQRKFLRFLNWKFKIVSSSYHDSCKHHHMLPLNLRRDTADLLFLHDILSNKLDVPDLLSCIKLSVPTTNRSRRYTDLKLDLPFTRTNYRKNTFIWRVTKKFNDTYTKTTDLFSCKRESIRHLFNIDFFGNNPCSH